MFNIKTINNISPVGLEKLRNRGCNVGENITAPDGIIVRSADMHEYEVNPELLGVARAGAGYNNIPIDELAEKRRPSRSRPCAPWSWPRVTLSAALSG